MKKIVKNKKIEKATRKFTDRELPRKVFWDKYETIKQNKNNIEDIYIINQEKRAYKCDVDEVIEDMKKIIEFYDNAIGKNNYYVRNLLEVTQYFEEQ